MNKDNKIKHETRVESSTRVSQWRPSNLLEAPEPRPGFKQRWIATMVLGQEQPTNVAKRMREGWEPRDIKTVKNAQNFPTIEHGKFAGYIGIEGMVLCEMPEEMVNQRNEYYAQMTENLMRSVEQDIHKVEQPGNPISKTFKTSVTRGGFKE
mgnify:FL=1|jgi:hypothetical protein|tara:strand:+ start:6090 stop:6545 length:456 start_codon:yes stop_codon:yes gene_type:complete